MELEFTWSDLFKALCQRVGREAFVKRVNEAVHQLATRQGQKRDEFLTPAQRGKLHRLLHPEKARSERERSPENTEPAPLDFNAIASFLHDLGISLSVKLCRVPWHSWPQGNKVIVAVGEKTSDQFQDGKLRRRRIDVWDSRAENRLVSTLARAVGIDCNFVLRSVPQVDPLAAEKLACWREEPDVGAIIVLGSDRTIALADPIARHILSGQKPPALFRRSEAIVAPSVLSDPEPVVRDRNVGILDFGGILHKRHVDEEILNPANRGQGFEDCGILMIDCRTRPILILAAGHGGHGTLGCVMSLVQEHAEIERRILASRNPDGNLQGRIGENRLFEVVKVKLHKPSPDALDDMLIDTVEFAWDLDRDDNEDDNEGEEEGPAMDCRFPDP